MFGYVSPYKCELKVCELTQYQAWYCGLCKVLQKQYGQIPRLVLDYDCTFLALLLAGVEGEPPPCEAARCGYRPLQKKRLTAPKSDALAYAADCNVLLYYYKLRDDWQDEKKLSALVGSAVLHFAFKKAKAGREELAGHIEAGIGALSAMEKAGEIPLDQTADAFGNVLRAIMSDYPYLEAGQRAILSWLGYHMGRWIYLADAWQDRQADQKTGACNPFLAAKADKERASFLLYAALAEMEKAFDLLEIHANKGLLENIVYQGCRERTKRILEGEV